VYPSSGREDAMKKIEAIVLMLFLCSSASFAGTKEDLAKEVLKSTDVHKLSDQVVSQVLQMQAAQLKLIAIPADRQAEEKALHEKIQKKLTETVNWEKLEAEYGKFLVEVYTEDELKAILTFSRSKEGQSIIRKEPVVLGKIMLLMQGRVQTVLPEIQKMTRDFSESVKKIK
jgi:hypothetical protein